MTDKSLRSISFSRDAVTFTDDSDEPAVFPADSFAQRFYASTSLPPLNGLLPPAVRWIAPTNQAFIFETQPRSVQVVLDRQERFHIQFPWLVYVVRAQYDFGYYCFRNVVTKVFMRPAAIATTEDELWSFDWPTLHEASYDDLDTINRLIENLPLRLLNRYRISTQMLDGWQVKVEAHHPEVVAQAYEADTHTFNLEKFLHWHAQRSLEDVLTPVGAATSTVQHEIDELNALPVLGPDATVVKFLRAIAE